MMSCAGNPFRWRRCWVVLGLNACLLAGPVAGAPAIVEAMRLVGEGRQAIASEDWEAAAGHLAAALEQRPDLPLAWTELTRVHLRAGQRDEALAALRHLASLGLTVDWDELEVPAELAADPEFLAVRKQLATNGRPRGKGDLALTLRGVTGLIHGIAWSQTTGQFYFGDANARAVWTRQKDGTLERFSPEADELTGVLALAVDDERGVLWAATAAHRVMQGFSAEQDGEAAVVEFDLATGAVRRILPLPRVEGAKHLASGVAVGEGGALYVTDAGAPILWWVPPGGSEVEVFAESEELVSAQAVALHDGAAYVADRLNGLLRVDLNDRNVTLLMPPEGSSFVGLEGLVVAESALLAVQAGAELKRVLRIAVAADGSEIASVTVAESGHLAMAAPGHAAVGPEGRVYVIGNTSWGRFEANGGEPTAPRSVPIFRL